MKQAQPHVGKARLLALADFLSTIPKKKFDFSSFANVVSVQELQKECSSTGCALGWATAMPRFKRLGLTFSQGSFGQCQVVLPDPGRQALLNFEAASAIFGIDVREARYLFCPEDDCEDGALAADSSPKEVAKHIRKFVKSKFAKKKSS